MGKMNLYTLLPSPGTQQQTLKKEIIVKWSVNNPLCRYVFMPLHQQQSRPEASCFRVSIRFYPMNMISQEHLEGMSVNLAQTLTLTQE